MGAIDQILEKVLLGIILGSITNISSAQTVGEACTEQTGELANKQSAIAGQGALECIPNSQGQYYWQAEGGGIALYDVTPSCSIPGELRWNGSSIQYCDGANWDSFNSGVGKLYWNGNWDGDVYWCDAAYHVVMFHYDCGCANDATWFECQSN
jgi:hypothetical protein